MKHETPCNKLGSAKELELCVRRINMRALAVPVSHLAVEVRSHDDAGTALLGRALAAQQVDLVILWSTM
jgi:hypothetical protein